MEEQKFKFSISQVLLKVLLKEKAEEGRSSVQPRYV